MCLPHTWSKDSHWKNRFHIYIHLQKPIEKLIQICKIWKLMHISEKISKTSNLQQFHNGICWYFTYIFIQCFGLPRQFNLILKNSYTLLVSYTKHWMIFQTFHVVTYYLTITLLQWMSVWIFFFLALWYNIINSHSNKYVTLIGNIFVTNY
jgi:hypothetical protein